MQVNVINKILLGLSMLLLTLDMSQAAELTSLIRKKAAPLENIFLKDYKLQEQALAEEPYFCCDKLSSLTATPVAFLATCSKETFEQTRGEFERQIGMIAPIVLTLEILENNISHIEIQSRLKIENVDYT